MKGRHAASERRKILGRLAFSISALSIALAGCGSCTASSPTPLAFAHQIIAPLCSQKPLRVELLRARLDPNVGKPSRDVTKYLLDIRVQAQDVRELWLLIDHESFPSRLKEVARAADGTWRFSGDAVANARWLGHTADITLSDVQVRTDGRVPVILGTITVEGMSPQQWVKQDGSGDSRSTSAEHLARSDIEVVCATWFELRPGASDGDESSAEPR